MKPCTICSYAINHHLQMARAIRGMKQDGDERWNAALEQVAQLVAMNPAPRDGAGVKEDDRG